MFVRLMDVSPRCVGRLAPLVATVLATIVATGASGRERFDTRVLAKVPDPGSVEEVLERLHEVEHELLPEAVRLIATGSVRFDPANPRRVLIER